MLSFIGTALFFVICVSSYESLAFAPSSCRQLRVNIRQTNLPLLDSKQDEIAELEERLRKLKEEKVEEQSMEVTANGAVSESPSAPVAEIDEPFEEMLSEQWKESDAESQGEGLVKNLISGVAILVAAIAFSQIPVGQEGLDKYSTAKPSTTIDLG